MVGGGSSGHTKVSGTLVCPGPGEGGDCSSREPGSTRAWKRLGSRVTAADWDGLATTKCRKKKKGILVENSTSAYTVSHCSAKLLEELRCLRQVSSITKLLETYEESVLPCSIEQAPMPCP